MKSSLKKEEKEAIKAMQKTWLSYRKQFGEILWNYKYERNSWSSTISSSMSEILRRQTIEMVNLEKMVMKRTGK